MKQRFTTDRPRLGWWLLAIPPLFSWVTCFGLANLGNGRSLFWYRYFGYERVPMAVVLVIGLTTLAGFFVAAVGVAGRLAEWRHPSSPPHRKGQFFLTLIAVQAIAMLLGAMASILIQLP